MYISKIFNIEKQYCANEIIPDANPKILFKVNSSLTKIFRGPESDKIFFVDA